MLHVDDDERVVGFNRQFSSWVSSLSHPPWHWTLHHFTGPVAFTSRKPRHVGPVTTKL